MMSVEEQEIHYHVGTGPPGERDGSTAFRTKNLAERIVERMRTNHPTVQVALTECREPDCGPLIE